MVPSDVKLYTWLDIEDTLNRALAAEPNWPEWLVDIGAYWDGVTIRIRPSCLGDAKAWINKVFEPRVIEIEGDLFTHLLVAMESLRGITRNLPVSIEETSDPPSPARVLPSFSRPTVIRPGSNAPLIPDSLSSDSPPLFIFHSFKGGVGRTIHAIALAQALAADSSPVLLVDADLEAPGISWLLETRMPNPPVSLSDLLALAHGDPDPEAGSSIALVSDRLQDAFVNGMYVLPAFRSVHQFHSLDIRPEHLIHGNRNPNILMDLLSGLGKSLSVSAVVIDLRAGLSELAAGALLDPRVNRVFVSNLSGQSIRGTELVLELLASRAPSSMDSHPIPTVILNQVPVELRGSELLIATEERFLHAISRVVNKDIDPSDALRGPTWFEGNLLTLSTNWDDALSAIRRCAARDTILSLAQLVPLPPSPPTVVVREDTRASALDNLVDTANRLVYAEQGEGENFLPISPLRRLSTDHRGQLPVSVIVGAKGAGKTFTYLQLIRRRTWKEFAEAADYGASTVDASILPVLQPRNASGKASEILRGARTSAVESLNLGAALSSEEIQDKIRDWLALDLHEGQWRENWLDLIAWSAGYRNGCSGAGKELPSHLVNNNKRLLLVFDGLEDLFQDVTREQSQKLALRSLLQEVPNWLEQQVDRPIGMLVFVRRDIVTASVLQNSGQLLNRYEPYALRWDRVEALRLVAWVAQQAGLFSDPLTVDAIRDMEEEDLVSCLIPLWGRKLGTDNSREGRSAEWVLAALSDFRSQIQARDVVRLLYLAGSKSRNNSQWSDRMLVPTAVRDAVADCSRAKITEISQESRSLDEIFKKLLALNPDKKIVPFILNDVGLSVEELELLELNGVAVAEDRKYYLAEIFRRGLDFGLPKGARPKVLALARRQQTSFG